MGELLNISVNSAKKAADICDRLRRNGRVSWIDKFIVDYSGKADYVIWYRAI